MLYGFTAFPFDISAEAERKVDEIILPNSTLYAIHLDQCLPWAEALDGRAFPRWLEDDLQRIRARIPQTHVVYVAITPTATDRRSLAPACGDREGEEAAIPEVLRGAPFNSPLVRRAYLSYARRVIGALQPKFVNIGIEISELALKFPGEWPAFETLFRNTYTALKADEPTLQIGIEMVLHSLSVPAVAAMVKPAVEAADYLGISFYPYTSSYGEHFGAKKLSAPPDEWRDLLEWLPSYTTKPIAICETGYSSQPIFIRGGPGFQFSGGLDLQDSFVKDLVRIANRDHYLFVVWFIVVDYEKLLERMPNAAEYMKIWMYTGLFTPSLQPKPAWSSWQLWREQTGTKAPSMTRVQGEDKAAPSPPISAIVKLSDALCSGNSVLVRDAKGPGGARAIGWTVRYKGDWELCELPVAAPASAQGIKVNTRSDKADVILIRLQHKSGESFNYFLPVGLDWQHAEIPFARFEADPQTRRQGHIVPGEIAKLLFGEGAGAEGASGTRTTYIAGLEFY